MSISAMRGEGFAELIRHYEKGTQEIRYLLDKECEVLYECKWCREIFRSILTFTAHKRSSCRSMFADLTDELELAKKFQKRQLEERGEFAGPSKGRMNLETLMEEQIRPVSVTLPHSKKQMEIMTLPKSTTKPKPVTEFVGGYQKLVDMPTGMAINSQIPDDRVIVVMPQEKSSRYGEMQLRNRRVEERYATLTTEQMKILQRIPGDVLIYAEIGTLQCGHFQCKTYRPFDSFEALVYHLTLTHHSSQEDSHRCYFCDSKTYNTFEKLKSHLKLKHGTIRKNHMDARKKLARRSYKRSQDNEHRSISPVGYAEDDGNESESSLSNNEVAATPPAPFLQSPIKMEEVETDEPMPSLKRMPLRRGRRQKGRSGVAKPVLSPAKIRQPVEATDSSSQGPSNAVEFNIGNIDEFLNIRSNENSLANQAQTKRGKPGRKPGATKKIVHSPRATSQVSTSSTSNEENKDEEQKDEEKIDVDELMETDSNETENNEEGEPTAKRRKPVSLIKGRTPRQRAQTSRLGNDYVVPKKYASTTKMLSENQYRAFAKEQAKQMKKDKRTKRKRRSVPQNELFVEPEMDLQDEERADENIEDQSSSSARKRGPYKRKNKDSQSKGSSVTPDEDEEWDNTTQKLLQQVKSALAKGSIPTGDLQIKQEETSSIGSKSVSPEPNSQEGFILPPLETATGAAVKEGSQPPSSSIRSGSTNASPLKNVFPSILTGSESELISYSPKNKFGKHNLNEGVPKVSDETRGESASRRKQNFGSKKDENDTTSDLKLVQMPGQQPLKPDDLTQLPVTLSTSQRRMLFGPLKPLFNANREGSDGLHQCAECGAICKTLAEGHKHMVSHLRLVRLICSLCDAGAFFCTDMRKHLMYRYCEKLHYAPAEMIQPGTPCMDALTADKLIRIYVQNDPGRANFTRGKIISAEKPTPYMPDPRIEQRLLGALKAVSRGSPRKIVLTSRKRSPNEDPKQGTSAGDDSSQQGDSQSLSQAFNGDDEEGRSSKDSTPPITTNDLLNQTEKAATSPEFLISHDSMEKSKETGNYQLPLTIRANPRTAQKTPSPEPTPTSSQELIIGSEQSQPEISSQQDSSELPSINQIKPNIIPSTPTAVRSPAPKPSILSRSPQKQPLMSQDSQSTLINSIATPAFQPRSETTIIDTIEQTQAPSSSESSQQATSTGGTNSSPRVIDFEDSQCEVVVIDDDEK